MALNKERLKQKIIKIMDICGKETDNPKQSKETFAEELSEAIIEEIKNITITATAPNGSVSIIKIE